jgi:hypothetical protein
LEKKLELSGSLSNVRQRARLEFLDKFPRETRQKALEYKALKAKENDYRRFLNAAHAGLVEHDIKSNAGFAYEGVEPLSSEEAARLTLLEKSRPVQDFLDKELGFRRQLVQLEEKHFEKAVKK